MRKVSPLAGVLEAACGSWRHFDNSRFYVVTRPLHADACTHPLHGWHAAQRVPSNYLRAIRVSCEWNEGSHKRDQDRSRPGASTFAPADCNRHASSTIKLYSSVTTIHFCPSNKHAYGESKLHFFLMRFARVLNIRLCVIIKLL